MHPGESRCAQADAHIQRLSKNKHRHGRFAHPSPHSLCSHWNKVKVADGEIMQKLKANFRFCSSGIKTKIHTGVTCRYQFRRLCPGPTPGTATWELFIPQTTTHVKTFWLFDGVHAVRSHQQTILLLMYALLFPWKQQMFSSKWHGIKTVNEPVLRSCMGRGRARYCSLVQLGGTQALSVCWLREKL